jgi:outer membrane receptor protein involved in Fe transport
MRGLATVGIVSLASAQVVQAQAVASAGADDGSELEQIVVTARKRVERLQDVPIAITAVSGDFVRKLNVERLEFLSPTIPSLKVSERTGSDTIGIRGISSGVNLGFEQSVGQVIDGFFYGRSRFTRAAFLDVERVEVLKGPQGALIGKNTTAGVINITGRRPTDSFEGYGALAYQFDGGSGVSAELGASGPVSDTLSARWALRYEDRDGWVKNVANGNHEPSINQITTRGSLLWKPTSELTALAQWTHGNYENKGSSNQLAFCDAELTAFLVSRNVAPDCKADYRRNVLAPVNGTGNFERFRTNLDMVGLTVDWSLGGHTLTWLSGYARFRSSDAPEGDRTPLELLTAAVDESYRQYSQELRVASPTGNTIEYIGGLFYLHSKQKTDFAVTATLTPLGTPLAFTNLILTDQKSDTYAVFGQATVNLGQLALTVDGRYTWEDKSASQIEYPAVPYTRTPLPAPLPPVFNTHDVSQARHERDFSPGVTLKWKPNDGVMTYASWRRGFKGGGFDAQADLKQQDAVDNFQFGAERVTAYEAGAKLTLADRRLTFGAAIFRSDFKDLQVSLIDNSSATGIIITRVGNAAAARSQGVELDTTWRPLSGLTLFGAVTYLEATFRNYDGANCYFGQTAAQGCSVATGTQDVSGTALPLAPKWAASMHAEQVWSLGSDLKLAVFGQAIHASRQVLVTDLDPRMYQSAYWKVDARITLGASDDRWSLALIGRNLSNRITSMDGNDLPNPLPGFGFHRFVDPSRSISLQGRVRF